MIDENNVENIWTYGEESNRMMGKIT